MNNIVEMQLLGTLTDKKLKEIKEDEQLRKAKKH